MFNTVAGLTSYILTQGLVRRMNLCLIILCFLFHSPDFSNLTHHKIPIANLTPQLRHFIKKWEIEILPVFQTAHAHASLCEQGSSKCPYRNPCNLEMEDQLVARAQGDTPPSSQPRGKNLNPIAPAVSISNPQNSHGS